MSGAHGAAGGAGAAVEPPAEEAAWSWDTQAYGEQGAPPRNGLHLPLLGDGPGVLWALLLAVAIWWLLSARGAGGGRQGGAGAEQDAPEVAGRVPPRRDLAGREQSAAPPVGSLGEGCLARVDDGLCEGNGLSGVILRCDGGLCEVELPPPYGPVIVPRSSLRACVTPGAAAGAATLTPPSPAAVPPARPSPLQSRSTAAGTAAAAAAAGPPAAALQVLWQQHQAAGAGAARSLQLPGGTAMGEVRRRVADELGVSAERVRLINPGAGSAQGALLPDSAPADAAKGLTLRAFVADAPAPASSAAARAPRRPLTDLALQELEARGAAGEPLVCVLSAPWSSHCGLGERLLSHLGATERNAGVRLARVRLDDAAWSACRQKYGVYLLPAYVGFAQGGRRETLSGVDAAALADLLSRVRA
eukprot:TRINITY_DN5483_c0_g1_i1.p1 TRINITY_DN5483_c0_g1~~TRINITY_DN5483_c0_g1_i1.p1  ORF type:complete len:444 (+),score=131.27 TRINITY_DN5483_c0_g1_i1:83-1333(+)